MPNQYKISVCNLPNDLCVRAWTGGQLEFVLSMHEALDSILSTNITAKKEHNLYSNFLNCELLS